MKQTKVMRRKKPPQVSVFLVLKKVELMRQAVARFNVVAMLMALARILVAKISEGINQALK